MKSTLSFGLVIIFGMGLGGCGAMGVGSAKGGFGAATVSTNEYGEDRGTGTQLLSLFGAAGDEERLNGAPQGSPESRWIAGQPGGKNPENPANDGLSSAEAIKLNGQRADLVKRRQAMTVDDPQYSTVTQQVRDLTQKVRDAELNFLDTLLNQQTALKGSLEQRATTELDPTINEQLTAVERRIRYMDGLRADTAMIPDNYTALTMNPSRIAQAVRSGASVASGR